jgi:hypothetical protein
MRRTYAQLEFEKLTRAPSSPAGDEGRPSARCEVPRQVPRPVRPRYRRQGIHQCWISGRHPCLSPRDQSLQRFQWAHIEQTAKSSIQEKKIRVLFLPADADSSSTPARTNGASRDSMLSSPQSEAAFTPVRGPTDQAQGPVSRIEDRPAGSKNLGEIERETYNPATGSGATTGVQQTMATAAASVSSAIPTSQAELQAQLDSAKQQIARLTQQASEGLRQRKPDSTSGAKDQLATATQQQTAPAGGVSVQITALLCLVSFLLAYFLF